MYHEFIHLQQFHKETREKSAERIERFFQENEPDTTEVVEILHEPPFNQITVTTLHDLQNMGYCGDHIDVGCIRDIRMLVNYYSFLKMKSCRAIYKRVGRNYEEALHRASCALLSTIANSEQCANIPAAIGKTELRYSAKEVARILIINCSTSEYDYDYNKRRDEINILAERMLYYFYAHIDHIIDLREIVPSSESK
jgi:hypothetical protein